jgi:hypothetical protein
LNPEFEAAFHEGGRPEAHAQVWETVGVGVGRVLAGDDEALRVAKLAVWAGVFGAESQRVVFVVEEPFSRFAEQVLRYPVPAQRLP